MAANEVDRTSCGIVRLVDENISSAFEAASHSSRCVDNVSESPAPFFREMWTVFQKISTHRPCVLPSHVDNPRISSESLGSILFPTRGDFEAVAL